MVRTHKNTFHSTAAMAAVRAQTRLTRNLHHKFAAEGHSNKPVIVGTPPLVACVQKLWSPYHCPLCESKKHISV